MQETSMKQAASRMQWIKCIGTCLRSLTISVNGICLQNSQLIWFPNNQDVNCCISRTDPFTSAWLAIDLASTLQMTEFSLWYPQLWYYWCLPIFYCDYILLFWQVIFPKYQFCYIKNGNMSLVVEEANL
jgi:hypothetical protein